MQEVHRRVCHLCEAMCGVTVTLEGRRVLQVRGDPDDPFSRGHVCPKAVGLAAVHEDPDRLTEPMVRQDGRLRPATWDEAFERTVEGLTAVQRAHGRKAVGIYQGNPTVHSVGAMLYGVLFTKALHTPNHFSATSLDQLPHMLAGYTMFGHQLLLPVPDLDRTSLLVIQGANPLISNGSLMSAGDVKARLRAIQARGGRVILIDPRATETAGLADEHLFIRPGTDAFLLAAVAQHILQKYGPRLKHLAEFTDGLDVLQGALKPFTLELAESHTGVPAAAIRALANAFAEAPRAAWYGRIGVCTQAHGGLSAWLINVINVITGNLDREGGVMFASPAVDLVDITNRLGMRGSFGRRHTRVRKLPEFGGEFPAAALAEELDTPGEGQIRALVTQAGNPVLSAPDGPRLDRALAGLEFMVSIDIYVNETTRHAHVILPPTFGVERAHFDLAFQLLAVRNTVKYSPPAFERLPQQRHDWEILSELFSRLRKKGAVGKTLAPLERVLLATANPERVLGLALRLGPYGSAYRPFGEGLTMRDLLDAPHGLDLGPLVRRLPERLQNRAKRIDLAPDLYLPELDRLTQRRSASVGGQRPLSLIGRRELRSNNSWMHNTLPLVKGKPRCTLR
ncbi:MAG: molybdopterin-dependent oxidoreductase, partial [Myxococcales bacterium]|nr:molybdopterin-dependent oxidoreductase [Myxococcales bacterium]